MSTSKKPINSPNELTLEKRVELIKFLEDGHTERNAAVKFKVSKGTVSNIKKRKEEYLQMFEKDNLANDRKRKMRKTSYDTVNQLTWSWLVRARSMGLQVSGAMIQATALTFATQSDVTGFTASNGWLQSFKKMHNISQKTISGEAANIDKIVVSDFVRRLPEICKGYNPSDIFNVSETGLLFRALPTKTMVAKSDSYKGGKMAKERISVLLGASANGEKLKPLLIGKSSKPRCFNGVNVNKLPVFWHFNKEAWMTSEIFINWLQTLNQSCNHQKRKILLFLGSCPSHPDVELSNITLKFLPPETTSLLQPMDQGVIKCFKTFYRQELLTSIIAKSSTASSAEILAKGITVLDAVNWVNKSWKSVAANTIKKCFKKAGFQTDSVINEKDAADDNLTLKQLIEQAARSIATDICQASAYVSVDDEVQVFPIYEPNDLINCAFEEHKEAFEPVEDIHARDTSFIEENKLPNLQEAVEMLQVLKRFASEKCPEAIHDIYTVECKFNNVHVANIDNTQQIVVTDYFEM